MVQVTWIKSKSNTWLDFQDFNLPSAGADEGVYIIWHMGNPGRVVRLGQGVIIQRLGAHRNDARITQYAKHGALKVTWASVAARLRDGVERYLADNWHPLVGDAFPDATPIAVNSPWG